MAIGNGSAPNWARESRGLGLHPTEVVAVVRLFGNPPNVFRLADGDHPELTKRVSAAFEQARIPMPEILVAEDDYMPAGMYLERSGKIIMSSKLIDQKLYPDVMYLIGHESGHKYSKRQVDVQLATALGLALALSPAILNVPYQAYQQHRPTTHQAQKPHVAYKKHIMSLGEKAELADILLAVPLALALRMVCSGRNEYDADNFAVRHFCSAEEAMVANLRSQAMLDAKMDKGAKEKFSKAAIVFTVRSINRVMEAIHWPGYPTTKQRIKNLDRQPG